MHFRCFRALLILALPVALSMTCLAADDSRPADSRPACGSQNQGQMWPDAANHDPKILSSLMRCGELFLCVRGTWHYHWETPSVRIDQLGRKPKSKTSPPVCAVQSVVDSPPQPDPSVSNEKIE